MEYFKSAALLLLSEQCYDNYFEDFNFLDVPCFKATLSKGLGLGIIAGSILVKVPQILKISSSRSGQGINILSVLLDLFVITSTVAYGFVKEFPFSSWGEGSFLAIQTGTIAFLVLLYSGSQVKAYAFVILYTFACYALMSGLTPIDVLWSMQAFNLPILLAGKLIQAYTNYSNGSTGQLSAITCFMLFFGSVARIFTSIQETGDNILILTYCVSSFCNSIIVAQLLWYWNSSKQPAKSQKAKQKKKKH
uniref:Mannose-P-dolichol utilization defect 1 protein homolog n=1 Tax=Xenopsylla cheopis TaxID=163159 RepID=A0A6M2DLM3_XENCH